MKKEVLVVIFGGQSSEHEISCMSATNILKCVNKDKYDIILVGITEEGSWKKVNSVEDISSGEWRNSKEEVIFSPDATKKAIYIKKEHGIEEVGIDIVFPVLHGLYGEDGTIQGLFEMAHISYVGCGVLASAVSMDKLYTKIIVDTLKIRQAKYVGITRKQLQQMDLVIERIESTIPYPVFIKPSCAGSSKGVSKAENREELIKGLEEAAKHDSKILVEETIVGREVECAVLDVNGETKASGVGEVLSAAEFYDFEAKYYNSESKTDVNPEIPEEIKEQIRKSAIDIFHAVDGKGLARVDFFLDKDGIVFNELNTLPGFTAISMYPMLWEEQGLDKYQLIQTLIDNASTRETK